MDPDHLSRLLQRHFDQVLTASERVELERMLLASEKARDQFWSEARWHAALRHWGESAWGREESPQTHPSRPVLRRRWLQFRLRWAMALTGLAVFAAILAAWSWANRGTPLSTAFPPGPTTTPPRDPTAVSGIALLAQSLEAVWTDPPAARSPGEALGPGHLRLGSGVLLIELVRGARLVLEGPADLELISGDRLALHQGKLRVTVPEAARGLSVRTPQGLLEDEGADFGCLALESGRTELHVFRGVARLHAADPALPPRRLHAGEALVFAQGRQESSDAAPGQFVSDESLARRSAALAEARLSAWRTASSALARRDDLLVHLDFEDTRRSTRCLANRAAHSPAGSGASLVGCDWVEGRWPGKGAVEFRNRTDRLWLSVPGTLDAVTFLAWVRVDSLPYLAHVLLTAEGPEGKIDWSLTRDGALSFGIQLPRDGRGWLSHRSAHRIPPQLLGTWLCLTTVCAADGTVTHYLNGQPAGAGRLAEWKSGRLRNCEIGNATTTQPRATGPGNPRTESAPEPPRNFLGRLDEFSIFAAALDSDTIRQLYTAGKPTGPANPLP